MLRYEQGIVGETFAVGETLHLDVEVEIVDRIETLVFGYGIRDRLGQAVFGTNTWHTGNVIADATPGSRISLRFTFELRIGVGSYSVSTSLFAGASHLAGNYEWQDTALLFEVLNRSQPQFVGTAWLPPTVTVADKVG